MNLMRLIPKIAFSVYSRISHQSLTFEALMNHGVVFNIAVLLFVLAAIALTHNPLCILAAVMLTESLPFGLLSQVEAEEDDDPKIGFNATL